MVYFVLHINDAEWSRKQILAKVYTINKRSFVWKGQHIKTLVKKGKADWAQIICSIWPHSDVRRH